MNSDVKPILAIVAVVAVAVIAVMALLGTSVDTEVLPPVDVGTPGDTVPDGGPIAVVISKLETPGSSFPWFWRSNPSYEVTVQFFAPTGCSASVSFDDPWPSSDPVCATEVPVAGTVSGIGTVETGESVIAVEVQVSPECFAAVEPGDYWPSAAACP
jgi:hypothetical protein